MNKQLENIRYVLFLFLLFSSSSSLLCQSTKNSLNEATQKLNGQQSLLEVIAIIESNTNYIFNYDPTWLKGYNYEGTIDLSYIDRTLHEIFYQSPFNYEIEEETILVYYPEPKTYRICGTIIDALSQEPLIAANIIVLESLIGTQSDTSGYFEFDFKAHKNQQIEIRYLGYEPIRFFVQELKGGDCERWSMTIDQDLFGSQIIISDYLMDGISLGEEYSGFNIDYDQLSKSHSNVEHDILKTAQLLPGINSIDDSASNLQIRGSNPGQNLVLWEGVPLYNAGHVFGMISAINPFSVEKVSIYKGAYDPQYDNRVGGIVDVSLSDDISSGFQGSIGTTLTEFHTNIAVPIIKDKVAISLAGRQSINSLFNSPTLQSYTDNVFQFSVIDDQENLPESIRLTTNQFLSFHDLNAKLLYHPTDRIKIKGGMYRNSQDFSYSFSFEGDSYLSEDKINLNTEILSIESAVEVTKNWSSTLAFYQSEYANIYDKIGSENEIVVSRNEQINRIEEQSLVFSNDLKIGSDWYLNLGYEVNMKEVNLDLGDDIDFDQDFVPLEFEKAKFHNLFQSVNYATKELVVDIGNRSSYYHERGKWFHSPRINLAYHITQHFKLKADAGIYQQFISQLTNFGVDRIKVDNPLWILNTSRESLSQQARKVAAGFVFEKGKWLLDLDVYHNYINNISTIAPQLGIITNEIGLMYGSSSVTGMDILLKKRWSSGIKTWLSYSLGFAKYHFPALAQLTIVAPNDIRHNLSFVSSYKYKNFQLSLNSNFHSGLPYSRPKLTFNEEDPFAEPPFQYYPTYDSYNTERLNPYLRFDLNLAYRINLDSDKGSAIEISGSLLNIMNKRNSVARGYFVDYIESTNTYELPYAEKVLLDRTVLLLMRYYW